MDVNFQSLRKFLDGLNYSSFSNLDEYQNKYYLKKEIQSMFLEIPDELIYDAIDITNSRLKENYLSRKYIVILCSQILTLFDNYNKNKDLI